MVAGPGQGRVRQVHRGGRSIAGTAPRQPSRTWLSVPNLITLGRIGLVPVFIALQAGGDARAALWTFVAAAVSDWVDGLAARLLDQRTKLGGILDPIADKALALAALVMLVLAGRRLPAWLLGLVVLRDGWMAVGVLMVRRKRLELPTEPSRIGKYATVALTATVVLALVAQAAGDSPRLDAYTAVMGFLAGLCVAASTAQYLHRFGYLFFAPPRSGGA